MQTILRKIAMIFLLVFALVSVSVSLLPFPDLYDVTIDQEASISPTTGIDYSVQKSLIVHIDNKIYHVPIGFVTDLASIPRALWGIIAPSDDHFVYPAILHDFLYSCPRTLPRDKIDSIFYSFLRERGVKKFQAYQFFLAVRIFGNSHFTQHDACHLLLEKGVS